MLRWLQSLFAEPKPAARYTGPYRAFTTAHDVEVVFTTRASLEPYFHPIVHPMTPFAACLEEWVALYEEAALRLVRDLERQPLSDIHVTILLDHSGSLRGRDSSVVAATAGIFSECLTRLNVSHEVLAFTTCSWRGGKSYMDWLASGSPAAPGRLCDLLHIVYRSADSDVPVTFEALEQMTDPWLLKENVDGEAIEWAVRRSAQYSKARQLLFIISDGAPVDDRTLLHNGPNILEDHLRKTVTQLIASKKVELYGLGIRYAMSRYYPQYAVINDERDIGDIALPVLAAVLSSDINAPQVSTGEGA